MPWAFFIGGFQQEVPFVLLAAGLHVGERQTLSLKLRGVLADVGQDAAVDVEHVAVDSVGGV